MKWEFKRLEFYNTNETNKSVNLWLTEDWEVVSASHHILQKMHPLAYDVVFLKRQVRSPLPIPAPPPPDSHD